MTKHHLDPTTKQRQRRKEDSAWAQLVNNFTDSLRDLEKRFNSLEESSEYSINELQDRIKYLEKWNTFYRAKDQWRDKREGIKPSRPRK